MIAFFTQLYLSLSFWGDRKEEEMFYSQSGWTSETRHVSETCVLTSPPSLPPVPANSPSTTRHTRPPEAKFGKASFGAIQSQQRKIMEETWGWEGRNEISLAWGHSVTKVACGRLLVWKCKARTSCRLEGRWGLEVPPMLGSCCHPKKCSS